MRPGGGDGAGLGGMRVSQSSVSLEANVGGGMQEGTGAVLLIWARDLCLKRKKEGKERRMAIGGAWGRRTKRKAGKVGGEVLILLTLGVSGERESGKRERKRKYLLSNTSMTGKFVQYIEETIYLHGSN